MEANARQPSSSESDIIQRLIELGYDPLRGDGTPIDWESYRVEPDGAAQLQPEFFVNRPPMASMTPSAEPPVTENQTACALQLRGPALDLTSDAFGLFRTCGDGCIVMEPGTTLEALSLFCLPNAMLGPGQERVTCTGVPLFADGSSGILEPFDGIDVAQCVYSEVCDGADALAGPGIVTSSILGTLEQNQMYGASGSLALGDTVLYRCANALEKPYLADSEALRLMATCEDLRESVGRDEQRSMPVCLRSGTSDEGEVKKQTVCFVCSCADTFSPVLQQSCDAFAVLRCAETGTVPERDSVLEQESCDELELTSFMQAEAEITTLSFVALVGGARNVSQSMCLTSDDVVTLVQTTRIKFATEADIDVDDVHVDVRGTTCVGGINELDQNLDEASGATTIIAVSVRLPAQPTFMLEDRFSLGRNLGLDSDAFTINRNADMVSKLITLAISDPTALFGTVASASVVLDVDMDIDLKQTTVAVTCIACSDGDCVGDASDGDVCPEGSRALIPSTTVYLTAAPIGMLPLDIHPVPVSSLFLPAVAERVPESVRFTVGITDAHGALSGIENQLAFVTGMEDALIASYAARGFRVFPSDFRAQVHSVHAVGETLSPVVGDGERRKLLTRALLSDGAISMVDVGVSIMLPYGDIDFDFIENLAESVLEDVIDHELRGNAVSTPQTAVVSETVVPSIFSAFVSFVGYTFNSSNLISTTSEDVGLVRGNIFGDACEGEAIVIRTACSTPLSSRRLGLTPMYDSLPSSAGARALESILSMLASSSSTEGSCTPDSLSSDDDKATVVLMCAAEDPAAPSHVLIQASRSPSAVDRVIFGAPHALLLQPTAATAVMAAANSSETIAGFLPYVPDAMALLNIKRALGTPALSSWSEVATMCTSWHGVSCNGVGKVSELRLTDGNELIGNVLHLHWLRWLDELTVLSLSLPSLFGDIGGLIDAVDDLKMLRELSLDSKLLEGDISGISPLLSLTRLDLALPFIRGDLSMLLPLRSLRSLSVFSNTVTGNVNKLLASMPLDYLSLVGPMVGDMLRGPDNGGRQASLIGFGRGMDPRNFGELQKTFVELLAESSIDEVAMNPAGDGVCSNENNYCPEYGSRECEGFNAIGSRMRQECGRTCGLCINTRSR